VAVALVFALAASCHSTQEPPPIYEPPTAPPLPPSSGTPVGYLVDGAGDLKLSETQLAKLQQIDSALATELDEIDTQMRGYGRSPSTPGAGRGGGGGGRRRGGMMGGSMNGAGGGMGQPTGGAGAGSGSGSAAVPQLHAADIGRLTEQRTAAVKDAMAQAMAVLDSVQRLIARKLLEERGVDVEGGKPAVEEKGESEDGSGGEDGSGEP
jgi:hypothetical protein